MNKKISTGESEIPVSPRVIFCVQFYDHVGGAESQLIKQMPYYKNSFRVKVITQGDLSTQKITNKSPLPSLLHQSILFRTVRPKMHGVLFYWLRNRKNILFTGQ